MQVVIANENVEERTRNRLEVSGLGLTCAAADCVGYGELKFRLSQRPSGELALVYLAADNLAAGLEAIRTAKNFTIPVVAAGPGSDAKLIIQATRLGAEFVDTANLAQELEDVLQKLRESGVVTLRRGHCVAVTAACTGMGATTVATNLAYVWGKAHPNEVALAELGPQTPEVALNLDLKLNHTVADLMRDADRLDAEMLDRAMSPAGDGVRVLASKPGTLEPPAIDALAMRKVVVLLRTLFGHVTLDLGGGASPAAIEAMRLSEVVVVVSRIDVPSIRLTRRYLTALQDAGIPTEKVKLALNRYGQAGHLAWKKAEASLPTPPLVWIPDDPQHVNTGLNEGKSVVQSAGRCALARKLGELAQHLNGRVRPGK